MATINTIHDFIRLLRENEEWRDAVRRELLTEELVELPQRFAEYVVANDKRTEELLELPRKFAEYTAANDKRMGHIEQDVATTKETAGEIQNTVGGLQDTVGGLQQSVDSLRGYALESKLTRKLMPLVSREFDVRRIYPIWTPDVTAIYGNIREFLDKIEDAAEGGAISDDEEIRLKVTDLILRSQRKADRSTLWFAVEASGVINDHDLTRAKRSADLIQKIYGQDAVPLVYGYHIHDEQRKLAEGLKVTVFLDPDRD